jgi:starch-binding outer membrane protein, SusD/RagB family
MKQIKISLFSLLLAASVISCKKELEILPTGVFEESRAFQTVQDLDQGALGVYAAYNYDNTIYINALLSDEARLSSENRGQGQFEFKWQYSSGTGGFNFGGFYSMIMQANKVLRAAPGVTPFNAAETTQKDQILAEVTALRAIAHFEILQRFGPSGYQPTAPAATYVTTVLTPNDKPARQTVADMLAGIEADLAAAKASPALQTAPYLYQGAMPTGYGNLRMSKATISGFQARVALYKRDWTNAAAFATEAINNSGKTLATGATFRGIWTDANDAEVFLRLKRTGATGTMWQDTNGDVFFEPSTKIKEQFNRTTDVRWTAYFKITPAGAGVDTALIEKYNGPSSRGNKIVDIKVMRIAEMYLIRAEARAELNDLAGASSDINTLRAARIAGYTPITYTDKAVAIADILNERFKELAYEGFRFFDLKRRGLAVNRFASDVTSPGWQNLAANDFHFALPIPSTEIRVNPNYTQNPGY